VLLALQQVSGAAGFGTMTAGVILDWPQFHGGVGATSNPHITSLGPDSLQAFAPPLLLKGYPKELLPLELQDSNPLGIWRQVNGTWTNGKIEATS
jgi:NADP-dependent aldehyde dehydrogenase